MKFDEINECRYELHAKNDPLWNVTLDPKNIEPDRPKKLNVSKFIDDDSNKDANDEITIGNDENVTNTVYVDENAISVKYSENTVKDMSIVGDNIEVENIKNENWLEAARKKLKKVDEKSTSQPKRMKKLHKYENLQITPGSSGKKYKKKNVGERKLTRFHDIRSLWERKAKNDENQNTSVRSSVKPNINNLSIRKIVSTLDIESDFSGVSSISHNLKSKSKNLDNGVERKIEVGKQTKVTEKVSNVRKVSEVSLSDKILDENHDKA